MSTEAQSTTPAKAEPPQSVALATKKPKATPKKAAAAPGKPQGNNEPIKGTAPATEKGFFQQVADDLNQEWFG